MISLSNWKRAYRKIFNRLISATDRVCLYHSKAPGITIDIAIYIDEKTQDFVLDGCDYGENVKKIWGDFDYEYNLRISGTDKIRLFSSLGGTKDIPDAEKEVNQALLRLVAEKYATDKAYSSLAAHCEENNIPVVVWTYA